MIIENGTIEVLTVVGGGLDEQTGFPCPQEESYGTPIPCQFSPVRYNATAHRDGEPVTQKSFSILIEEQPQEFAADRVRLTNSAGRVIGEFSVISVEALEAVGQVKITV